MNDDDKSLKRVQFNMNNSMEHSKIHATDKLKANKQQLTFLDFFPSDSKSYILSIFRKTETYDDLMNKVNEWLYENQDWHAKNIETILFDTNNKFAKCSLYVENVCEEPKQFGIRLWICPRTDKQNTVQKIKVINFFPKIKITGLKHEDFFTKKNDSDLGISSLEDLNFESMDDIVNNINKYLSENPYLGQIINIETIILPIMTDKWSVQHEDLRWPVNNIRGVVHTLRIYFQENTLCEEIIQLKDFVPVMDTWNAPLAVPNLEPFTSILKRASQFLKMETSQFRFLSCSTVRCPISFSKSSDQSKDLLLSKQTFYSYKEWFHSKAFFSKFVRIFVAKPTKGSCEIYKQPTLNCKIFVPKKKECNEYEDLETMKSTIEDWFKKTKVEILSVESETLISPLSSTSLTTLIDTCLHLQQFPCSLLHIFKVYINGHYTEPSK